MLFVERLLLVLRFLFVLYTRIAFTVSVRRGIRSIEEAFLQDINSVGILSFVVIMIQALNVYLRI